MKRKTVIKRNKPSVPLGEEGKEDMVETPLGLMKAPMSETYKLMLRCMNYAGTIPFAKDSYNYTITEGIKKIIEAEESRIPMKSGGYIQFKYQTFNKPTLKEGRPLFPREARLQNLDYKIQFFVTIQIVKDEEVVVEKSGIPFFELPCMLKSAGCNLDGLTEEEQLRVGSDPNDPGGYYIVVPDIKQSNSEPRRSKEVFHLNKDSLMKNVCHVFKSKTSVMSKVTISTNHGTQQVGILKIPKTNVLRVKASVKEGKEINVMTVMYVLQDMLLSEQGEREEGEKEISVDEMVEDIVSMTKKEHRERVRIALTPTLGEYKMIENAYSDFADKLGVNNLATYKEEVKAHVTKVIFPTSPDFEKRKIAFSILVVRLLEYMIGVRGLDDRDHWGNKRIDTSGNHIQTLFSTLFIRVLRDIRTSMETRIVDIVTVESCCVDAFNRNLTQEFHSAFTGASWGPSNSRRSNAQYVEPMPTSGTLITVYSLLSGLKKPTKNKVMPSVRQVKTSGWGFYGPGDSPEGNVIGLKLFLSALASVSLDRKPKIIENFIKDTINNKHKDTYVKVMLNGIFQGWADGEELEMKLRDAKRHTVIPKDIRIYLDTEEDEILYIDTYGGRPVRLMLVVEDGELVINKKDLWNASVQEMVTEGVFELVDPLELKNSLSCFSVNHFRSMKKIRKDLEDKLDMAKNGIFTDGENINVKKKKEKEEKKKEAILNIEDALEKHDYETNYDYCEIDPNAVGSYSEGLVPLSNHNPIPRISYQANMNRQAVGRASIMQHLMYNRTTMEIIPTGSFTETGLEDFIGQGEYSPHQPMFMCIRPNPTNQEDSIDLNQSAVDRGMAHFYEWYTSPASETNVHGAIVKRIKLPNLAKYNEVKRKHYRHLDDRGIARIGSIVDEGDVLIAVIRENVTTDEKKDVSITVRKGEGGQVESIHKSKDSSGNLTVLVKVRQARVPIVGDKFQMGAAQKGTVGSLIPEQDMPFVIGGSRDMMGMKPDVVINPHAFPSRMTVGALLEMVLMIFGIKTGTMMDVSSFQEELTMDNIQKAFHKLGIHNQGKVQMASGITGMELEGDDGFMFMLPISYRQLKHVTHNKMHARGTGARKLDTRQPVGGRQRDGAPRFGRMESDVLASHGTRANLRDRLAGSSDAFDTPVCIACNQFATTDLLLKTFKCSMCENESKGEGFGRVELPFISINIKHQFALAGIHMKFKYSKGHERQIHTPGYEEILYGKQ